MTSALAISVVLLKTFCRLNTFYLNRSRYSLRSPDAVNEAERVFLTSRSDHHHKGGQRDNVRSADDNLVVPGLSDFDEEIGIYRTARDNISALPDRKAVGWILFDFQPIKQVYVCSLSVLLSHVFVMTYHRLSHGEHY